MDCVAIFVIQQQIKVKMNKSVYTTSHALNKTFIQIRPWWLACLAALCILGSCSKDETPTLLCVPTSLVRESDDSIAYELDALGRIALISYYDFTDVIRRTDEFEYNSNGLLLTIQSTEYISTVHQFLARYEIKYGSDDIPDSMLWYQHADLLFPVITRFTHDSKGRLVAREYPESITEERYEYDNSGNIVRAYHKNTLRGEILAWENMTFDNNPVFYSASTGLNVANVYAYRYMPNRNNPLKSVVHYKDGITYTVGVEVNFTMTYNIQGWPTAINNDGNILPEIYSIYYSCR